MSYLHLIFAYVYCKKKEKKKGYTEERVRVDCGIEVLSLFLS